MTFHIGFSEALSGAAFLLSLYSTKKTIDFNRRQTQFIETTDKLNQILLDKEQSHTLELRQAEVSANFVTIGRSHRLKIFNKGKATAENVRMEFPDGNEVILESDMNAKLPMPTLEQFQNVEILAAVHMGSPSRMTIKLVWDDPSGKDREKVMNLTL